ncbi:MAG: hypothetical protein P8Y95_08695, partial [Gammaproteobacteria bacterium]
ASGSSWRRARRSALTGARCGMPRGPPATQSQVIAFVSTATLGFLLLTIGLPEVLAAFRNVLPSELIDALASMSYQTHFQSIGRGVLEIRDLAFFLVQIVGWLVATRLMIELKKS